MKNILINPISGIPASSKSHTRGFENRWAKLLNATIMPTNFTLADLQKESPDEIVMSMGVNYKRAFGIIGGLGDAIAERIIALLDYMESHPSTVFSVNFDEPANIKYDNFTTRVGVPSTSKLFTQEVCDKFVNLLKNANYKPMSVFDTPKIAVGDSHTVAYADDGCCVYHNNGKTLYGVLRVGVDEFIKPYLTENTKDVDLSLGSIDIRHHILRPESTIKTPEELAQKYIDQVKIAESKFGVKINVCAPVPVETAERVVPKSAWFKNQPFYGTEEERREFTMKFIAELKKLHHTVIQPTESFYAMCPKKFAEDHMERPRSIHFSPEHYRPTWA